MSLSIRTLPLTGVERSGIGDPTLPAPFCFFLPVVRYPVPVMCVLFLPASR
jgi:hypothetical protein